MVYGPASVKQVDGEPWLQPVCGANSAADAERTEIVIDCVGQSHVLRRTV
jgi:hypothetical protein